MGKAEPITMPATGGEISASGTAADLEGALAHLKRAARSAVTDLGYRPEEILGLLQAKSDLAKTD
jgi:hypothetical protein